MRYRFICVLGILALVGTVFLFTRASATIDEKKDYIEAEENIQTQETISVSTTPPCTYGRVRVLDKNNKVIFEGIGEIDIKSNGWNGNAIQVEMYVDEGEE